MDRIDAMRLYVRVVELDSFSAAAGELRITQSTASKWIAALEQQLGVALLERTTRAKRLSDAGERFYVRAKELLASFDDALADVRDESVEPSGRLRVSVPVVFGRRFVVPTLASFMQRHAKLELELSFGDRYVNLLR
ncbi:MAG: LysR family transcriptional regulator, partial [Deltaproteobacteria bacterium]|nr:LysR family transcriptional regulator [Deltaproteobacteria bacterium]